MRGSYKQNFPNNDKSWGARRGKSPPVANWKFSWRGDFFTRWWEPEEGWFWLFEPFAKLKTAFCEKHKWFHSVDSTSNGKSKQ